MAWDQTSGIKHPLNDRDHDLGPGFVDTDQPLSQVEPHNGGNEAFGLRSRLDRRQSQA